MDPDVPLVVVLVLGDVGRSPRMQYHALSLARTRRARVRLVGFRGERCVPEVEAEADTIEQTLLTADLLPRPRLRALYALYAPLKAVLQFLQLMYVLLISTPRADVLLVQTPPAIPTLAAAWLMRATRGTTVVTDWHNLGFTVMQHGGLNAAHPFVRLSRWYERFFGRQLDAHLCVTRAMSQWLEREWGVRAQVLHDRPPSFFRPLAVAERHALLRRLASQFVDASGTPLWPPEGSEGSPWNGGNTPWTVLSSATRSESASVRPAAPSLLVSSTSWTADEDFGMLLSALSQLDQHLGEASARDRPQAHTHEASSPGPSVVAVITGKGPMKDFYLERMRQMPLRHVAVCTMWLEPADYPALLGSADLGVCLHTSTSGLDLPMKVLDMFGCGMPVCAVDFACLDELVIHGTNGLVFSTPQQLAQQLKSLLSPEHRSAGELARLREGVAKVEASKLKWADNWREQALPLILPHARREPRPRSTLHLALAVGASVSMLLAVILAVHLERRP